MCKMNHKYLPRLLCLSLYQDRVLFEKLKLTSIVIDEIDSQLNELIRIRNPDKSLSNKEVDVLVKKMLSGVDKKEFGIWVYYSWSNKLIHTLNKEEFIEVRTSRNLYKITNKERDILGEKTVGIIGLSVGKAAAITMASERCFGQVVLADFDQLELSNMNRISTGLHNIGLSKTVIVAREISEMDPFIKVKCVHEGVTPENIDSFFSFNGRLDLIIEECDSLDIKVLSRQKAKQYSVPLISETNDRGLIDIERYDLDPEYLPFHGALKGMDLSCLNGLSNADKLSYILKIHPLETLSERMRTSITEIGKSIQTWPQLASGVNLGGGVICDTSRKILLGETIPSGRFFVDLDKLICSNLN